MQTYYISKLSNTSADALLAVGFAKLLQTVQLKINKRGSIIIQDAGSYYIIESATSVTLDDLQQLSKFSLVQPIITKSKEGEKEDDTGKSESTNGFDYQKRMDEKKIYYAA